MTEIELKPVKSSNTEAVGYDEEKQELQIQFKGGGLYAYDSVPAFEHRDLIDARSIGSHFHQKIKDKFATRKLK
jgi:hypothetical protein